ncbi:uncharacterized protein LOC135091114 isoform X2 [Scylla paramamosain]|uniref:uncharacterized protein LOC135091114 isoform X2 n=1 Tax=Scylla paramamosain TaxID=85552 RepID=UPI003082F186
MQVKEEPACTEAGRNLGLLAQYHCSDEILVWKCSCFVVTKRSPPVVRLNPQSNRFCGEKTHDASIYKVASRAAQKRTSIRRSVPYYVLFSVKRRHGEPVRRGKQWAACRQGRGILVLFNGARERDSCTNLLPPIPLRTGKVTTGQQQQQPPVFRQTKYRWVSLGWTCSTASHTLLPSSSSATLNFPHQELLLPPAVWESA